MKRYILFACTALMALYGCNQEETVRPQTCDQDSVMYVHNMMGLIMNNYKYLAPDYSGEFDMLHADSNYFLYKSTKVFRHYLKQDTMNTFLGYKEVKDPKLNLTLRIHRWTCGCEISLPKTIIYVSNRKDFDYAFIYHDETIERRADDSLACNVLPDGPPSFEFQLNFLLNTLRLNNNNRRKDAQHFLSLITDSLLSLKRLTGADTMKLRKEQMAFHEENNKQNPGCKCADDVDKQINRMIQELNSSYSNVQYYRSSSKYYKGFWRFEFLDKGYTYISAEFIKGICGVIKYE